MDGTPAYPPPQAPAGNPQYPQYNKADPAPAAPAAAIDPTVINYGYGPAPAVAGYPQPPFQPVPQIIIQNDTAVNAEPGCVCGLGWILFGIGWLITPAWFVGAILFCTPHKPTDRDGFLGCLIMSIISAVFIIISIAANMASS